MDTRWSMDPSAVVEIDGTPVRTVPVEVAPGLCITIFESSSADDRLDDAIADSAVDPYASVLWPASIAVAMELPQLVSPGDFVLDLGAGTGLATLTAARLGAYATAYDHDPFALRLVEEAARMQGLAVDTIHFDLHSPDPLPPADLITVADLFYDHDLADSVARRVVEHVLRGGLALIGDPGRTASPTFLEHLDESGIYGHHYVIEVQPPGDGELSTTVGIHVYGE